MARAAVEPVEKSARALFGALAVLLIVLFPAPLAGCGRLHDVAEGPWSFTAASTSADGCAALGAPLTGTVALSGHYVWIHLDAPEVILSGLFIESGFLASEQPRMVLDGTLADPAPWSGAPAGCAPDQLAIHAELSEPTHGTTLDGTLTLRYESDDPACACESAAELHGVHQSSP